MKYIQFHARENLWENNGYILRVNVHNANINVPFVGKKSTNFYADQLHYNVFIHLESKPDQTDIATHSLLAKHDLIGLAEVKKFASKAFVCLPLIGYVKTPNDLREDIENIILKEIENRNRVTEGNQNHQSDYVTW